MGERARKSRFVWADGYIDHRSVFDRPTWERFRWDREDVDVDKRYDLLAKLMSPLGWCLETANLVTFERIRYDDGSFEFRERCGG